MFSRSASLSAKRKQHRLDRLRPPSPLAQHPFDQGVASFVVQCAGTVDLSDDHEVDLSYKKKLLQFVYQCQTERRLPKRLSEKSFVQLQITAEQMKVVNSHQKTILSIPSHHIIACYYVEYERDHIVAMKYVTTRDSSSIVELTIFLLNDRDEADELCSSMECSFRAVYMANESNSDISKQLSLLTLSLPSTRQLRSSFDSTTSSTPSTIRSLSLASASSARVVTLNEPTILEDDLVTPRRRHRRIRPVDEDNAASKSSAKSTSKMIQNYLLNLQRTLESHELEKFGQLLGEWQSNQSSTKNFVEEVAQLYGESRRNLLDGLHEFLLVDEQRWFRTFLNNLESTSAKSMDSSFDAQIL